MPQIIFKTPKIFKKVMTKKIIIIKILNHQIIDPEIKMRIIKISNNKAIDLEIIIKNIKRVIKIKKIQIMIINRQTTINKMLKLGKTLKM